MSLHVGSGSWNSSKVFFEFSIYSNFYEIFRTFSVEEKYTKGERFYTTLFGVCKVIAKPVSDLNTLFGSWCNQFYFIQRNVTSNFTYAFEIFVQIWCHAFKIHAFFIRMMYDKYASQGHS